MASAAADGEKPSAHLAHPLLAPPQPPQPYYAYPAAAYASPPPLPPPPLVLVPAPPVLVRLRRLRPRRISCLRRLSACLLPILLLALLAFLLYPSAPAARVADLRLDRFRVNPPPFPALNLHLALRLLLRNPGLLPIRYRAFSAAVSYRGHLLGSAAARPGSGQLAARGVTYADAEVWVDAGRVLDDVIELIGDLAAGSVPLEIVTEVVGAVRVFRFDIPVKIYTRWTNELCIVISSTIQIQVLLLIPMRAQLNQRSLGLILIPMRLAGGGGGARRRRGRAGA